jgi:hypothetical protein
MTARQTEPLTTTRALLALGSAAGPVYVIVGIVQILTREGFDWTRHALSLMSNGAWGWVQIRKIARAEVVRVRGTRFSDPRRSDRKCRSGTCTSRTCCLE